MNKKNFIDILMENNPESVMEFLLENGKSPKPVSPIYFLSKENKEKENN